MLLKGTNATVGMLGHTLDGAQLHHRLIVQTRSLPVQLLFRQLGKQLLARSRIDGRIEGIPTREHPIDIAIDHRIGLIPRKRDNGSRCIVADSLQGTYRSIVRRKDPPMLLHDHPGSRMHIPGPAVVAQPLPILQNLLFRSRRQSRHIGKTIRETHKIIQSLRHTGLLENNFGHPDQIGILRIPPRQIPTVLLIPVEQ